MPEVDVVIEYKGIPYIKMENLFLIYCIFFLIGMIIGA